MNGLQPQGRHEDNFMVIKRITKAGREWMWPAYDGKLSESFDSYRDIDAILTHVPERRMVVQAGGGCGVWPWYLAQKFEQVYTFEPDSLNYRCLTANLTDIDNVTAVHCALTHQPRLMKVERHQSEANNAGAGYTRAGGNVASMRLDDALSLSTAPCDLLCLDVEGTEGEVILGASAVISSWRPVIVIEEKSLPQGETINARALLESYGYVEQGRVHNDVIFRWGK